MIDTKPTVIELDYGEVGYFYSLHQLEHMRSEKWKTDLEKEVPRSSREGSDVYNVFSNVNHTKNRLGIM